MVKLNIASLLIGILVLIPGCNNRSTSKAVSLSPGEKRSEITRPDLLVFVLYQNQIEISDPGKSVTNRIDATELGKYVPKGSNLVARIDVPVEQVPVNGRNPIRETTDLVLQELRELGFRSASIETRTYWFERKVYSNVTFALPRQR